MNIDNYRSYFDFFIMHRGMQYYSQKKIARITKTNNTYEATVNGSNRAKHTVKIDLEPSGNIGKLSCSCPYANGSQQNCKHIFAVLLYLEEIFDDEISDASSPQVSNLIAAYTKTAVEDIDNEPVKIIPELYFDINYLLTFKLKIGREKMYVVNNIENLVYYFENNETKQYGKNFEFTHSYNLIDDKSRKIMKLAHSIFCDNNFMSYSTKEFPLKGMWLEQFLEIYSGEPLIINKQVYEIVEKNPKIDIILKNGNNNRISFSMNYSLSFLGRASKGYFISQEEKRLYLTNIDFLRSVEPLMKKFFPGQELLIGKSDIPAFYNSVVKQLEKYTNVQTTELPDDIIPPQMSAGLYIDINSSDEICANLEFTYGEKIYPVFYDKATNPFCDKPAEKNALLMVEKYFEVNPNDKVHPFIIRNDSDIFEFITTGMSKLSKIIELYVSDRFQRIKVRQTARPNVGVKTGSGLLELDITATGYTQNELLELLQAYRQGNKFHRFKDGSFSMINESMEELSELTKELNITDKMFLKQNISVPMYRMLYINSLQSNGELMRISRSKDFKRLIESYEKSLNIDEEDTPSTLVGTMRDYQKTGFDWLRTLGKYRLGGILADDMGLGKTIQAIALMLKTKEDSDEHKQFLVICPSSLTINWESEIKKFAPTLSTVCLNGTAAERNKLFESIDEYDVVITSYATALRDIDKYENLHFAIQFLDEAQSIKNHNTMSAKAVKAIKSDLRFALTGTPIENTLAELWSIFDFIMPGYLYNYSYFKKNFEVPIVKKNDEKAIKSLQRLTSPFILRRLKKDVLTELPEKTETILYTQMESEQKKIYTANAAQIMGELKGLDDKSDKIKILAMLTRLRQLCCDPALVYENYDGGSAKLEQCIELIKSCIESGHKILLFSQFTTMLDRISTRLTEENVSFYTLTGKTKSRERLRLVNEFNENNVSVFLISLKAGGTGLNLTGADIVIHYDPWWNLSAENQASDRAYRIGQKNNVQIYKLIVKNTIEEKIRILQQKKSDLLDVAVSGEGDIMNMTTDEVISLLE